ncbi:MAG TPA: hypothetical protein VF006_00525 [Longimicrobium sp.]
MCNALEAGPGIATVEVGIVVAYAGGGSRGRIGATGGVECISADDYCGCRAGTCGGLTCAREV